MFPQSLLLVTSLFPSGPLPLSCHMDELKASLHHMGGNMHWLISLNMTFSPIHFPANDAIFSISTAGYNSKAYIGGGCILIGGFPLGDCHDEVGDVSAISQSKICG